MITPQRLPYWGCPTCRTRECTPGNFRVYTCFTCGTNKCRYGEATKHHVSTTPTNFPLHGGLNPVYRPSEGLVEVTAIVAYTEPHPGTFVCNWCGANASFPAEVKHHESCAPPPPGDTLPDDFQTLTTPFTPPNGVTFKCIIHEGCLRLVYWLADEDPAIDDPWIIASIDAHGNVETFGDLPGVECTHYDKD